MGLGEMLTTLHRKKYHVKHLYIMPRTWADTPVRAEQRKRDMSFGTWIVSPLNSELNPICHLLALLGTHHIFHVSRIRVKMHLQEVGCGVMDWIKLAQDRDRWRALESAVMNYRVAYKCGEFLD